MNDVLAVVELIRAAIVSVPGVDGGIVIDLEKVPVPVVLIAKELAPTVSIPDDDFLNPEPVTTIEVPAVPESAFRKIWPVAACAGWIVPITSPRHRRRATLIVARVLNTAETPVT